MILLARRLPSPSGELPIRFLVSPVLPPPCGPRGVGVVCSFHLDELQINLKSPQAHQETLETAPGIVSGPALSSVSSQLLPPRKFSAEPRPPGARLL